MADWLLLITNLPGRKQTLRMRLWRGLKASGAALLRDGVYLLPEGAQGRRLLEAACGDIVAAGGTAYLMPCRAASPQQQAAFIGMFDRSGELGDLIRRAGTLRRRLPKLLEPAARREFERLQREFAQLSTVDFFPGPARQQAESAMQDAREALSVHFSADEPHAVRRRIIRRDRRDFSNRTWATREHLWIDRVCSAWLIKRFIDPRAKFLWLKDARRRPRSAVGFDFDGADFTHSGSKVTFEVLLHSFGLEQDAGLVALASLVHYLDVGGVPVAEAAGLAAIVGGARALGQGDDELLATVRPVMDSLHAALSGPQDK
jgi:hypothetical protein